MGRFWMLCGFEKNGHVVQDYLDGDWSEEEMRRLMWTVEEGDEVGEKRSLRRGVVQLKAEEFGIASLNGNMLLLSSNGRWVLECALFFQYPNSITAVELLILEVHSDRGTLPPHPSWFYRSVDSISDPLIRSWTLIYCKCARSARWSKLTAMVECRAVFSTSPFPQYLPFFSVPSSCSQFPLSNSPLYLRVSDVVGVVSGGRKKYVPGHTKPPISS